MVIRNILLQFNVPIAMRIILYRRMVDMFGICYIMPKISVLSRLSPLSVSNSVNQGLEVLLEKTTNSLRQEIEALNN